MSVRLYEHNQIAYESALAMLAETGRAAVIHPTGTGKSFIGFKLCEDFPDKTVCWMSPSEYIFRTQLENWRAADESANQALGQTEDQASGKGADLFDILPNIRFLTYAKLIQMDTKEMAAIRPDVIVLDEFHRCGAAVWGAALKKFLEIYTDVPVLGLSATNIRYLDNQRDMADELFDGNVASEMTLGEAIVRGILAAPKYVMAAFVYQKELEKLKNRISRTQNRAVRNTAEKYYEALRRALEKADGLDEIFRKHMDNPKGKYIVFTANIEAMRECMEHVPEWFGSLDRQPHVYSLYTLDPSTIHSFEKFKADDDKGHLRLLFCIDALNEGIHVDDVDGVILFRPTASPTVYKQQIGRALSVGKAGVPVIFDIVNNFDALYSIGSLEEEMRAAVTYYNYAGESDRIVADRFRVVDEVRDCRRLFDELEEALTASWDAMYVCAKAYRKEHGDLEVPVRYRTPDGCSLGRWVQIQRQVKAGKMAGNLDEERIAKLDALGMRWQSADELSWERHYAACRNYYEEHGDLNVPGDYTTESGMRLGGWLKAIRAYRRYGIRSSYFTKEREKMLDDLGMIWNQPDYLWERNYAAAKSYYEKHGNLEVPAGHIENGVKLYNWLADLRRMYRNRSFMDGRTTKEALTVWSRSGVSADNQNMRREDGAPAGNQNAKREDGALTRNSIPNGRRGTLTDTQVAQMDALGMRWQSKVDIAWDRGYVEARKYYEQHGTADASLDYVTPDGYKLGVWLSKCREKYAKGTLSDERVAQLEAIGMVWDKSRKNDWDACFEKVKEYYLAHGNLSIPGDYTADGVWLNKWLNEQKQILLGNRQGRTLTEEQKQKLATLPFAVEGAGEERWQRRYGELLRYYSAHGNSRLPVGYRDSQGQNLYVWLVNQRGYARSGRMSDKRKKLLMEVGALNA